MFSSINLDEFHLKFPISSTLFSKIETTWHHHPNFLQIFPIGLVLPKLFLVLLGFEMPKKNTLEHISSRIFQNDDLLYSMKDES